MSDLALDVTTGDIVVDKLDLKIIEGADAVRQQLDIKLNLWSGEWFLDTEFGTPYLQDILGKQITLGGAIASIKQAILEVDNITDIQEFTYTFSRSERRLIVDFIAVTPLGLIRVKT